MNQAPNITTLRQTHRAAASLLPVLTATLTVAGAVIAAMEARAPRVPDSHTPTETSSAESASAGATASRVTVRAFIATLVGRALLVALSIALVCSLVYVASASGRTGQAILLTALILLALYLTEKVARRA
jgi:hypothetical protein